MNEAKRSKANHNQQRSFLVPAKSVGQVVDGSVVPSLYHRGGMWFSAMVSGDTHFNITSLDTLHTVFTVSLPDGFGRISAIASKDDLTVVYTDAQYMLCYERADLKWSVESGLAECKRMLLFEDFMIAVSFCGAGKVDVLGLADGRLRSTLSVSGNNGTGNNTSTGTGTGTGKVTAVIHPNTYLNKLLFGFDNGDLELWNVKTGEMIHRFKGDTRFAVTSIAQSPDADIIAVGRADHSVTVMSIKGSGTLGHFKCTAAPTAIAFRFDSPPEDVQVMTADEEGELIVWSIKGKARPVCRITGAHRGPIAFADLLVGQPIIVSCGRDDNAVKEWIVECEGREVRLLRSREGPATPITAISFTTSTTGESELVCTSERDDAVVSLSLGLDTKIHRSRVHIPTTTAGSVLVESVFVKQMAVSACDVNLGWDDSLVLVHGQPFAKTMCKRKNANGKYLVASKDNKPLQSAACSRCGHYGAIASLGGLVSVFNMQSGVLRLECSVPANPLMTSFDSVSRRVVTVSQEGTVCVISLLSKRVLSKYDLGCTVKMAQFHVDSNTAYVLSADDYSVSMFDVDLGRVVRKLEVPSGVVSDLCVTPDSKWLLCGQPSGAVLLYDLISGVLIGQLPLLKRPIRAISVSPQGDIVATVGVGCNHADLWWFQPHHATSSVSGVPGLYACESSSPAGDEELLLSMSMSRFLSIVNWQSLCEQNKPKVPVKKASAAPFFLSELAAAKQPLPGTSLADTASLADKASADTASLADTASADTASAPHAKHLLSADSTADQVRAFLLDATVTQVHDEVMLGDVVVLQLMASCLDALSLDPKHFDRCLAVSTVMLRHAGPSGLSTGDLSTGDLSTTTANLSTHWQPCHELLHSALNVIRFCKNTQQAH